MTDRELLDALARDVAEALTAIADREESWAGLTRSFASSIYARHARWPEACPREEARADAAEATVRELRELCGEAADFMFSVGKNHARASDYAARLRAAAVQPASEGRADGERKDDDYGPELAGAV